MSNLLLADLTNATRTEITRKLPDVVSSKKNTLGILVGSQVLRTKKTGNAPFDILRSNDLAAGEAFQIDFQVGFPVAVGAKAITGSMASLKLPQQANFNVVSGKITPSYYQLREDIRTAQVERVKKSPKVLGPNLASKISQSAITGFMKKWNDDLFPDAGCTPCYAAGVNGIYQEDKMMALAYPLQSGYVLNAASGSGTYPYIVDDMNATGYTTLKALNVGTTASGFGVMSPSNLRTKLTLPMEDIEGAMPNLLVCDSAVYDYGVLQAEGKVVIEQEDMPDYAFSGIAKYAGVYWLREGKLDTLYATTSYREAYLLDANTWEFRWSGLDGEDALSITPDPDTKLLVTLLGKAATCLICHVPRYNARAYNVTLS